MHGERSAVCRSSIDPRQRHRTAPHGDGALVAQEPACPQARSVFVRTDAALDLLPFEGIEIVVSRGIADPGPNPAERGLEIAPPEATGIRSGIQCLSYGE